MNIDQKYTEQIAQWVASQGLMDNHAKEMQIRCTESLERHAFMLIMQDFDDRVQELYNETLELDGAVDGFGFLTAVYGEHIAHEKINAAFYQAMQLLISKQ